MRNLLVGVTVIVIVIILGGLFLFRGSSRGTVCDPEAVSRVAMVPAKVKGKVTITYSGGKFSPSCVVMSSGRTITWINDGDSEIQIGANPHPIHTGNKEVSSGGFVLTLKPGEQATVKIEKIGSFGYHNHLSSSQGGTITVE